MGCTGCSLHVRLQGHMKDLKAANKKNAMVKHFQTVHPNHQWRTGEFVRARVVTKHCNVLTRFIDESLRLEKYQGLANSRGEWGRGGGLIRDHSVRTNTA